MDQDSVNPLEAFATFKEFETRIDALFQNTNSASVALLALEGLYRIEEDVNSGQFTPFMLENIRESLRKWRCESPLYGAYGGVEVVPFLRKLTIFKTLKVPLFIDDYGDKLLMNNYGENVEQILIDLDTPIVHVTHSKEKTKIVEQKRFLPSHNRNSVDETWFSPTRELDRSSIFGNWAFETTLRQLGVSSIRQGEIVSYKNQVNFTLYASDTFPQNPVVLSKATDAALRRNNPDAYSLLSIFVPSRFLQQRGEQFQEFIAGVYRIAHGPFCVKEKRNVISCCTELDA